MNLEDEIAEQMSKEIAAEIDFEILSSMLVEACGWHRVKASPMTWEEGRDIDQWVKDHTIGKHYAAGLVWVFEDQRDAVNFTLKWL